MKKLIIILMIALGMATTSIAAVTPADELAEATAPEVDYSGLRTQVLAVSQAAEPVEAVEPAEPVDPEPVRYYPEIPLDADVQSALFAACDTYGIDYSLALGLIQTESRFDPYAVSCSGCYGLCQLNPVYFPPWLPPAENITYGMEYLARQIRVYGSIEAGLCAYNAGHDTGERFYSYAVLAAAAEWTELFNT